MLEDTSVREQFTDREVDQDALVEQLAGLHVGDLTVAVLSQDARDPWVAAFHRTHDRLARASTDGVRAIGIGSGLVARAVEAVWSAASAGTELPPCRVVFRGEKVRCRV